VRLFHWVILALILSASLCSCRRGARRGPAAEAPRSELYFGDPAVRARLVRGIERIDDVMWSKRLFAVRLDRPEPAPRTPLYVELDFGIPEEMRMGELVEDVTLTARVYGVEACRETFRTSGRKLMACPVPAAALDQPVLVIEYESDRTFRAWETGEELALVLAAVRVEPYEATEEYHLLQAKRARRAEEETVREWDKYPPARRRRMRQIMAGLPAWSKTSYLGVRAGKNPADLWMVQQLLYEVQPDFVVATGAEEGGAALFYAWTLESLGRGAKVVAIGDGEAPRAAADKALWKANVEFISGAAVERPVVEKAGARVAGGRTLVILGAGGAKRNVAAELRLYAPLVSSGSYLIVEDTQRNSGTAAALQAFLAGGGARDFEPDRRRESFLIGFHNGGWLKRK